MKKIIIVTITLTFLYASFCFYSSAASSSGIYNWYCVRRAGHCQPSCEPSMEFIEKYGGYYIDKAHGDESLDKVVYLTFDAGYENGNVEKILDVMKSEKVSGAFFILSHLIDANPSLVKRMANEGHLVCNHTSRHKDMTKYHEASAFAAELKSLEKLYSEKIGGCMSKYYRPPEGKFSEENLKFANELGYKTVFWSFAYADWDNSNQMAPEKAMAKILDNVHNGAVLLLHPTSETNAKILGNVIRTLKAEGYRFGSLDELTGKK